jgi:hypothetical protein
MDPLPQNTFHLRSPSSVIEIYRDFDETLPPSQEYLRIQFSPSSGSLKERWRTNGLSANFMADFLITFFLNNPENQAFQEQQTEIQGIICYIANELLENAMKFAEDAVPHPISLTLYRLGDRLIFFSTNSASYQTQTQLRDFIHHLSGADLGQLYLAQLEESAVETPCPTSGLGILTMMHDYHAQVGWKIEPLQTGDEGSEMAIVTTMVQITL